jgi:hypothetical protein
MTKEWMFEYDVVTSLEAYMEFGSFSCDFRSETTFRHCPLFRHITILCAYSGLMCE